jgi:hypothetical protein
VTSHIKGKPIRITADLSVQNLYARNTWNGIYQALKANNCLPRLIYSAKCYFIIEGEIKTFYNNQKVKELMTTKPTLLKILKGILHSGEGDKHSKENARKDKQTTNQLDSTKE